jgi:hypothetical protein
MFDRLLSAASLMVGVAAIVCGMLLAFKAPGALLEELMWFCAIVNFAMGSLILIWRLKAQQWLTAMISNER